MSAQHTPGPITDSVLAKLDDQAERAVSALEASQRQRNELRAERDAAIARVAELEAALQRAALSTEEINALPEAGGWWPMGQNDRILRLVRAVSRATIEKALNGAAIAKPTGSAA